MLFQVLGMQLPILLAAAVSAKLVAAFPHSSYNTTTAPSPTSSLLCELDWLYPCLDNCSTVDLHCKRECYRNAHCDETRPNKTLQTRPDGSPTSVGQVCDKERRDECLKLCGGEENEICACACQFISGCGPICDLSGPQIPAPSCHDKQTECLSHCHPHQSGCPDRCFAKHPCDKMPPTPTSSELSARALATPPREAFDALLACLYRCDPRKAYHYTCVRSCAYRYTEWPEPPPPPPPPEPEPSCDPASNMKCIQGCQARGKGPGYGECLYNCNKKFGYPCVRVTPVPTPDASPAS